MHSTRGESTFLPLVAICYSIAMAQFVFLWIDLTMSTRGEGVVIKGGRMKKNSIAKASCTPLHTRGEGRAEEYGILGLCLVCPMQGTSQRE